MEGLDNSVTIRSNTRTCCRETGSSLDRDAHPETEMRTTIVAHSHVPICTFHLLCFWLSTVSCRINIPVGYESAASKTLLHSGMVMRRYMSHAAILSGMDTT